MKNQNYVFLNHIFANYFVTFISCGLKTKTSRTKNGLQTGLWETLVTKAGKGQTYFSWCRKKGQEDSQVAYSTESPDEDHVGSGR